MKNVKIIFSIMLIFFLFGCNNAPSTESSFFAMDTVMDIKIYGHCDKDILVKINDCISKLESELDRSNNESEIFKLNSSKAYNTSPEAASLISTAVEISEQTDGAFDITVAPIMDLWGFFDRKFHVPSAAELSNALKLVDYKNIYINETNEIMLKNNAEIDLGGIAKGYLSDKLYRLIKENGISSAIMSLGGNVCCAGTKPNGEKWTVGIQNPQNKAELLCSVKASDCFIVTSGTYERYFEQDNKRYHHIINPKTGFPVDNSLASVTIICKNGTRADALSTALFVMGMDNAYSFYKKYNDFEAVFITDKNQIFITPGIEASVSAQSYTVLQ